MTDKFEEWDFRRRERIRNTPDWDDWSEETLVNRPLTVTDILFGLLLAIVFISFWGGIGWLIYG